VRPKGAPFVCYLAAAAVVIAAAVIAAATAQQIATATVAQQNENQNDPADVAASEAVIVTHSQYLRKFLR
jgi:hypothetical protein